MCIYNSELLFPIIFFAIYILLEAQDWGLSIMTPIVTKSYEETIATGKLIKPGLDGNELWLFLGLFVMGSSVENETSVPIFFYVASVFAVIGLVARIMTSYITAVEYCGIIIKLGSFFSLCNIGAVGLLLFSWGTESGDFFTVSGIIGTIWILMVSIQIGAVYGAVKVENPLAERWRALNLVTALLELFVFIPIAVIEIISLKPFLIDDSSLWVMLFMIVIFSITAFALVRMRLTGRGMIASYFLFFLELMFIIFTLVVNVIANNRFDEENLSEIMGTMPFLGIVGITLIWTISILIWKMLRKKINYTWNDHI